MICNFQEYAKSALKVELESIQNLSKTVDSKSFNDVCQTMLDCKGKIFVMGIGKSGHIGAKFSASLSSTGTPSAFVHAAEAAHGDLGVIQKEDIVIFISNSGQSNEFNVINGYFKSNSIKVIAITSNTESSLARSADLVLDLAVIEEACPLNLAPTSSTTNTLVLSDLLVVSLLRARNFNEDNFATYHPQGRLGRRLLMSVNEFMHTDIPLVREDSNLVSLISEMTKKKLGLSLVTDSNENLLGLFTDGDLRRLIEKEENIYILHASDVITTEFKSVVLGSSAYQALLIMQKYKIGSLPVIKGNKAVGIINLYDLLNAGL